MNKLTLSCFKSLVQTRPKGDWVFLTKLALTWPEARAYFWIRKGYRNLLESWPILVKGPNNTFNSFLSLSGVNIFHGIGMTMASDSRHLFVEFNEQGELLMVLAHRTLTPRNWVQWDQLNMLVLIPFEGPDVMPMKPKALAQLFKDRPWIKQKIMRALNLARDMGHTKIKTLEKLAALMDKENNPGQEIDSGPQTSE